MKFLGVSILATAAFAAPLQARGTAGQVCDNPGRVVSLVLDSSSSTEDTDPNRLRIQGGLELLDYLTSASEATEKNKADTVSIVSFDQAAKLEYPQGDPNDVARAKLSAIDSVGMTKIYRGIRLGLDQILKSNPGNRGGLILFTDGQDTSLEEAVEQINRATAAGVRVSIGHTSVDEKQAAANQGGLSGIISEVGRWFSGPPKNGLVTPLDERISQAALASGGTVSVLTSQEAQKEFVQQVIKNGITNNDGKCSGNDIGESGGPLINNVHSLGLCSKNAEAVFTYSPKSQSEELTFEVNLHSKESTVNIDATFINKATGQTSTIAINKNNLFGELKGAATAGQECEKPVCMCKCDTPGAKPMPKFEL
ncbi:hypothetical protein A1Q2_04516 [Trichosporon asahii var. asahii CBS 8904]|uniref:VWFA domain-containing protein n=2 Tax=Trichosporon asahii var. asahii TaxID=189963 RepID=K1VWM3_TRIAC|nr:hypothetical protein A1Q1_00643 [Trichosporon asahii var. asahii CBS 2479]EJT50176.1 hypothetical protein A1Q1_00643 [Trichosporon asahii var. asahii CBS 2479]EKD01193.1 hypothetical protein A1Q2_04516 [Trichosporon asahii var. asahii CBS 8904]